MTTFSSLIKKIHAIPSMELLGKVSAIQGLSLLITVNSSKVSLGSHCTIKSRDGHETLAEIVGFKDDVVVAMPYGAMEGISPGCEVSFSERLPAIFPSNHWKGRIVNGMGEPIDSLGDLSFGDEAKHILDSPPTAHERARVLDPIDTGIRSLNTFTTCCKGQRMGIFAGSGVGKSMLMSMLARYTQSDVCVIGLIGERGREVKDFIDETLGKEGMRKSILVVATSDESPLMRRQAAHLTLAIAEYYRDQGLNVLCLVDSVTRFAMAQREIGLATGEPPTTKGYTPSVFSELPKLLERAGPGYANHNKKKKGYITAFFTVLVDGDDHNEPIADAVRGILDGHIVLDRHLAEKGHYPAINILKSVSRTVPHCHTPEQRPLIKTARHYLSVFEDMADMIQLGAYKKGSDPIVDKAIEINPDLIKFLQQDFQDQALIDKSFNTLKQILDKHGLLNQA